MPDQHFATLKTILHSINKNNCLKLFTKQTRDFCQLAVSPDAN
jgi:hypothetical protein